MLVRPIASPWIWDSRGLIYDSRLRRSAVECVSVRFSDEFTEIDPKKWRRAEGSARGAEEWGRKCEKYETSLCT